MKKHNEPANANRRQRNTKVVVDFFCLFIVCVFYFFLLLLQSQHLFFIHAFLAMAPTTSRGECEYESSLPASVVVVVVVARLIGLSELG